MIRARQQRWQRHKQNSQREFSNQPFSKAIRTKRKQGKKSGDTKVKLKLIKELYFCISNKTETMGRSAENEAQVKEKREAEEPFRILFNPI